MRDQIDLLQQLRQLDGTIRSLSGAVSARETDLQRKVMEENLVREALTSEQAKLEAAQSKRRQADIEVKTSRERKAHFEKQLTEVKTNVEYQALLREIATAEKRIREWEDTVLEAMEAEEIAQKNVKRIAADLAAKHKVAQAEREQFEHGKQAADQQVTGLGAQRDDFVAKLSAPVRSKYERVRQAKGDSAIVAVVNGSCGGCHYKLPPQTVAEVRHSDRLMICEGCGRILVAARGSDG
jgi:predicted  nucleic acid-binding Zn-ribbon protein